MMAGSAINNFNTDSDLVASNRSTSRAWFVKAKPGKRSRSMPRKLSRKTKRRDCIVLTRSPPAFVDTSFGFGSQSFWGLGLLLFGLWKFGTTSEFITVHHLSSPPLGTSERGF